MKTTYSNSFCAAEVSKVGNAYEINRIITNPNRRGQGWGNDVLRKITRDADWEGITLQLGINAYGAMNEDQLRLWYGRNGFYYSGKGVYARLPKVRRHLQSYPELKPMHCYPSVSFYNKHGRLAESEEEFQAHLKSYSRVFLNDPIFTDYAYDKSENHRVVSQFGY